jgi:hypothetical protein
VAGDTEVPDQPPVLRVNEYFHRTALGETGVEVRLTADGMELVEIQLIATEPIHCLMQLVGCLGAGALLRLASDEDIGQRISLQVTAESKLCVRIARRDIDLIDASPQRRLD